MRRLVLFCAVVLGSTIMMSCGGGSTKSGTSSPPITQPPSFTVSLSPASLTLQRGGASQNVQVSIAAHNGFTGSVSITPAGMPNGVTVTPSSLSLTAGNVGTFTLSASTGAAIAKSSTILNAVSGTLQVTTTFEVSVNGSAVADPFHMIGGILVHGFYDEARQLLFVANPGLNEVDVISPLDFAVRARVPVPQPWGIDQMPGGNTLVIGTQTQQILTLDENTLAVTRHPVVGIQSTFALFYPNVAALANGKVLMIGLEEGIDSSDIQDGGQHIVEWNSMDGTFKEITPTGDFSFEVTRLARSADHKWAIFSADKLYLYSSDADTFTSAPLNVVNPPDNTYGVRGYAMNADGTRIAVASAAQVTFLDRSFNVLGVTPIPSAFQTARTSVTFTPDGNRLLLQYDLPLSIEVLDANAHSALGFYPGYVVPENNEERLLAVNSSGQAFVGISGGIRVVDMTGPVIPNQADMSTMPPVITCPLPSSVSAPLNTTQQLSLSTPAPVGTSYYFGGQPAPVLSDRNSIEVPASSVAGPVHVECIAEDGNSTVYASAFSYGVDLLGVSANLLPPFGNPFLYLYGFGFSDTPSVQVGGQSATVLKTFNASDLRSVQIAALQLSQGAPNETAGVTLSSADGSGSLDNALTFIPSEVVLPRPGLLQVLYDRYRNLVYALKATEVDVLDPSTARWQSPIPLPGGGTISYNVMALSPDGSRLVAASSTGSVAVLDPDHPDQASLVSTNSAPGYQSGSLAITKYNKALLSGSPNFEIDLSSLNVKTISTHMGDLIRASADGSFLYGVDLNVSSGAVYLIDPATYAVQTPPRFGQLFWTDLAVSPDGSQFAGIDGSPTQAGALIGFFNAAGNMLNTNVFPLVSQPDDVQVLGSTFSPGGKVLAVPLGDSIEFWDAFSCTLRARLMTPEELRYLVYPEGPVAPQLALDANGQSIFAISTSGLTIMRLAQPIEEMAPYAWALSSQSASNTSAFSGTITARAAAIHNGRTNVRVH